MSPTSVAPKRPASVRPDDEATQDEAFRILRSNLEIALLDLERATVIVTSAEEGEGKSSVCANLAIAFARNGHRVILVDLDLRRPQAHVLLRGHNEKGVTNILVDDTPLQDCLQFIEVGGNTRRTTGLYLLATGAAVSDSTEVLGTAKMRRLLEALARQADIVLLDTPPVLPVADTLVIGRLAGGAVLVVEARCTPTPGAPRAKDALTRNQTRLLGVVLNRFKPTLTGYGYGSSGG